MCTIDLNPGRSKPLRVYRGDYCEVCGARERATWHVTFYEHIGVVIFFSTLARPDACAGAASIGPSGTPRSSR
jgi:hypothetical protein